MATPDVLVRVLVHNIAGMELDLAVQETEAVKAVKALVEEQWGWPVGFQRMLLGTAALADSSTVSEHCAEQPQGKKHLEITCLRYVPYGGDVHKATLAGDRDAVRVLMQHRDVDRRTELSAGQTLDLRPELRWRKGWPGIREALVESSRYSVEQVDAALDEMTGEYCYAEAVRRLQSSSAKRERQPDSQMAKRWPFKWAWAR